MKIIVLDYGGGFVETVPMTKTAINQHNLGEFNCAEYLAEHGYKPSNCNWMVCDEDPIPVYAYGQMMPYTAI